MTSSNHSTPHLQKAQQVAFEIAAPCASDVDAKARFPHEAFEALKKERFLSAGLGPEFGGAGVEMVELAAICETLGQHCAATAMIYAMHLIQVACIARHHEESPLFRAFLTEIVEKQYLIASVTSEIGSGGELRSSTASLVRDMNRFSVEKDATTISYAEQADALLLTARSSPEAPSSDQLLVLLKMGDYSLERKGVWDTFGMRGTCSPAFRVTANAPAEQVLPAPFAAIACQTMVPFSHVLWASCWLGIAVSAVARAAESVRVRARTTPGTMPAGALRLAETTSVLELMRTNVHNVAAKCERLVRTPGGAELLSTMGLALEMNNLKVSSSELLVDIVHRALLICGVNGYRNDSRFSLGRHVRDAYSAPLMVNNDRIYATNASMLLVLKDE